MFNQGVNCSLHADVLFRKRGNINSLLSITYETDACFSLSFGVTSYFTEKRIFNLTNARYSHYSDIFSGTSNWFSMANSIEQLERLEKRISELIDHCHSLREENTRLKREFAESDAQRTRLLTVKENASKQIREAVETLQQISTSSWVNRWTTQMKALHQAWKSK